MEIDENLIDCKCPHCGKDVSFPDDAAGSVEKCPNCLEDLVVPREGGQAAGRIPLPITTSRLVLRRLTEDDWKDLLEFLSDEQLFQFEEQPPAGEKEILEWLTADRYVKLTSPNTAFCLAIVLQREDKVIGNLYLHSSDEFRWQTDVIVCIGRNYRQQGFAAEALLAILGFCFDGIRLHRVSAWCDSRNAAGRRLAESTGMRREGELIKQRYVNGEWVNITLYAMLNEEYGL